MGKRTEEEKKTSKVTPAAGGDCAKLFAGGRGGRGTSFANNTREIGGKKVLEISEKFHKESNLAVWMLSRAGFSTHKDKVIQNWTKSVFELDRRFKEVGSMGLAY